MVKDKKQKNAVATLEPTSLSAAFLDGLDEGGDEGGELTWLPEVRTVWGMSPVLRDREAGAVLGSFYLHGVKRDMGEEFRCTPVALKEHALWLRNNKELMGESYDGGSKLFKKIQGSKNEGGDQFRWGADILVWLPDYGTFAKWFIHGCQRGYGGANIRILHLASQPDTRQNVCIRIKQKEWNNGVLYLLSPHPSNEVVQPPSPKQMEVALQIFNSSEAREPEVDPNKGKDR